MRSSARPRKRPHTGSTQPSTWKIDPFNYADSRVSNIINGIICNYPNTHTFSPNMGYAFNEENTILFTHSFFKVSINPVSLKNETEKQIFASMLHQAYKINNDAGVVYKGDILFKQMNSHIHVYELTNNVVTRSVKPTSKTPGEIRLEVMSNNLFSYSQTTRVFAIERTLHSPEFTYQTKPNNKKRLVKVITFDKSKSIKENIALIKKEFEITSHTDHIHMKAPTFDLQNKRAYLVMLILQGTRLDDILIELSSGSKKLSVMKRLQYGLNILQALKNQIHDKGVIHRDLKPENILIDDNNDNSTANIFDLGLAQLDGEEDIKHCGSPLYVSPEVFLTGIATKKSDVYAFARIFALILGFNPETISNFQTVIHHEFKNGMIFEGIFSGISEDELSDEYRSALTEFLYAVSALDANVRYSVPQAIRALEEFIHKFKNEHSNKLLSYAKEIEDDLAYQKRHCHSSFRINKNEKEKLTHSMNAARKLAAIIQGKEQIELTSNEIQALRQEPLARLTAQCELAGLLPNKFFMAENTHKLTHLNCNRFI